MVRGCDVGVGGSAWNMIPPLRGESQSKSLFLFSHARVDHHLRARVRWTRPYCTRMGKEFETVTVGLKLRTKQDLLTLFYTFLHG